MLLSAFDWRRRLALPRKNHSSSRWPTGGLRSQSAPRRCKKGRLNEYRPPQRTRVRAMIIGLVLLLLDRQAESVLWRAPLELAVRGASSTHKSSGLTNIGRAFGRRDSFVPLSLAVCFMQNPSFIAHQQRVEHGHGRMLDPAEPEPIQPLCRRINCSSGRLEGMLRAAEPRAPTRSMLRQHRRPGTWPPCWRTLLDQIQVHDLRVRPIPGFCMHHSRTLAD
jgi:hypothetical protein